MSAYIRIKIEAMVEVPDEYVNKSGIDAIMDEIKAETFVKCPFEIIDEECTYVIENVND